MPPTEQEERLVTVYADIHYYFAPPTIRPVLHRFDKASYFYIYYNQTTGSSRIEVANNPGAAEQDAFNGFLDNCRIINSHKFPTLLTLEVDGVGRSQSAQNRSPEPDEWRLASGVATQSGAHKYRLHTLDIYFWAEDDAKSVVTTLKHLLQPEQLDIAELEPEPEPEHAARSDIASPLVQNLENVAISDPAYRNGQTRNSQNMAQQPATIPPPPAAPQPSHSVSPQITTPQSSNKPDSTQNFTPMAYNPAAPAAPEPIAHREDTPPPIDDGHGTGLAAAARHDNVPYQPGQPHQPYPTGQPPQQQQPYRPGEPVSQPWTGGPPTQPSPFTSPPPQSSSTLSYIPSATQPTTLSQTTSNQSQQYRLSSAAQHYTPDAATLAREQYQARQPSFNKATDGITPGAQFYSTLPQPTSSPHKPLQHVQPQYPDYLSANTSPRQSAFEMSAAQQAQLQAHQHQHPSYNYGAAAQQGMLPQAPSTNPYDVHSQVYRPSEQEAAAAAHGGHGGRMPSSSGRPPKESRVEKAEKKASGWMKKLENKVGL
ncbi:uncharacterized protein AB675_810 [Cyphellophora attinorum]|uniref:Uncharacterized protein n=1 Tax=Cyphellophora attinorum TaxID=1664694 RepID=A0A0N1HBT4_9EURO|nr:uncharacterized protein AB675_810 [Phialophora attinorum]KPI45735.1 hypothetical protein AB675_810 [Phialophora attinorum]